MPTYDYQCQQCNHLFEEVCKINDRYNPTNSPCPNCNNADSVELVIGSPRIVDPIRLGVKKPTSQFVERMKHIKNKLGPKTNINV